MGWFSWFKSNVGRYQDLLDECQDLIESKKVERVNDFFNGFTYQQEGEGRDHWQTVNETLTKGTLDCEDAATGKYFTLKKLDVSTRNMRISYHKLKESGQAHMIMLYRETKYSPWQALDNMNKWVEPLSELRYLEPSTFSFNEKSYWKDGKRIGPSVPKLSKWTDLLERMNK